MTLPPFPDGDDVTLPWPKTVTEYRHMLLYDLRWIAVAGLVREMDALLVAEENQRREREAARTP